MWGRRKKVAVATEVKPLADVYIWHDRRTYYGGTTRFFLPQKADLDALYAQMKADLDEAACEIYDVRSYDAYVAVQWRWPREATLNDPEEVARLLRGIEEPVLARVGAALGWGEPRIEYMESVEDYETVRMRPGIDSDLWQLGG